MTEQTTTAPATNMERIKAGIWDIHEGITDNNEKKDEEKDNVMKGTLPKYKYVAALGQRYLIQREFEKLLAEYRAKDDFVGAVVTEEQFHADKAAQDLAFFGVKAEDVTPVPATEEMIAFFHKTAERDPRLLLSIHYVIEGSNNGAMFIAKAVKDAYGLEGNDGTYHLQPYGKEIRTKWKQFGESFNNLPMDDALMAEMVAVGRETFAHMGAMTRDAYALPEPKA
jgi:heme oxygenase